ncbi:MAG: hypothetical protein GQ527_02530 [Bacteroidales bacterium]|nr:hypothetical protein [Bacteroidales bacterium]
MKKLLTLSMIILFALPSVMAQEDEAKEESDFGRNNISLFMSDIIMKRVTFEYEHIVGDNGNMSINVPISVAVGETYDVYDDVVDWWVGLGMKLYPTGQGTIRYFFGPEVRIISARSTYTVNNDGFSQEFDEELIHSAFLLNNGMIYEPTEHFIFTVSMGLGFVSRDSKDSGFYPMATPSVRMGFRF